jgi:hypothetical protein
VQSRFPLLRQYSTNQAKESKTRRMAGWKKREALPLRKEREASITY